MKFDTPTTPGGLEIQAIMKELFQSTDAIELSYELEVLLSNYVQHAPVDRLSLSNTVSLITKLVHYLNRIENALMREELTQPIEQYLT